MVSLLLVFFSPPDYYVETPAVFQRAGEADSVSLQAACQRGERERQTSGEWVGVETALERRGSRFVCDLSKDLRANF